MNWTALIYAQSSGDVHVMHSGAVSLESNTSAATNTKITISIPSPRLVATANQRLGSEIPEHKLEVNHG
ncbi:MAG: hypothetical protein RLZZ156_508 [Deinococcota bacterium]|jgi:hypothetical protein